MRRVFALILAVMLLGCAGCESFGGAITPPPSPWGTETPDVQPSEEATPSPSDEPSEEPSVRPSVEPSEEPSTQPSDEPSVEPSVEPSTQPSTLPSTQPSTEPSVVPSAEPSGAPVSGDSTLDTEVASVIAAECPADGTQQERITAVFDWMVDTLKYKYVTVDLSNGYTDELVNELATYTITTLRGACEHQAALMKVFADALGAPAVVVKGDFLAEDGSWTEHAWVIVQLEDGSYRHIDVLYGRNHTGGKPHTMLLKTDEEFSSTHRWNSDDYPVCE